MKEEKHVFNDQKELEECLAAIVYNVEKDKSNEVLLNNSIQELKLTAVHLVWFYDLAPYHFNV